MAKKSLRKFRSSQINIFRIVNRRGFAAICMNHLTEGRNPAEAFARMTKALKRKGLEVVGAVPKAR